MKKYPLDNLVFLECGCCGGLHHIDDLVDCRNDHHRFTCEDLDAEYGERWEYRSLEDQEDTTVSKSATKE